MSKISALKNIRKGILLILGFLVIITSVFLSQKIANSSPPPRKKADNIVKEVYTIRVKNDTYKVEIPTEGILTAYQRVQLTARVQGVMLTINPLFKPGQFYKKGQTLLKIDPSDFKANVTAQRAALLNQITAILPDLELDFPKAYPNWRNYVMKFVLDQPTLPLPEMEEKERLFVSGRGIISSYYSLQNLEQTLAYYSIQAPFDGILVSATTTEGSLIRPGQSLGEFIAPEVYELRVALPKSYIQKVEVGAQVKLHSIDTDQIFMGTIVRINSKVNTQTQSVEVFIQVKNKNLKEGMFLEANINAVDFENVFALDRGLLNGDQQLYIVENNKLVLRQVVAIHFTETLAIVKGLKDGEIIIAQPLIGAYEGMEVLSQELPKNE
jgi:multidrug efflux pump subunit AcrA (membrane-fusion protein)